ncbi:transglycosylase SLT domain-containing protein [Antrihabitans sp. YC2-6]|uniref:lytic transglycosylase domain-containing protein n=1 Tax=Antrihabitans sp. YC2-6 TaxID=2799498 RepID=UPI0027DCBF48|nr:transglycosylase SLT domain-containing protein [Antrihabitans sp. YC2-6]
MIDLHELAQPIIGLLTSFGTGLLQSGGPSDALRSTSVTLDSVQTIGRNGMAALAVTWDGRAADNALATATSAQRSTTTLSDRGNSIADVVNVASADVNAGLVELEGILESFVSIVVAAAPTLATPPGQLLVVNAAMEHLGRALGVVGKVRAQLAEHTANMTMLTPGFVDSTVPATTAPVVPAIQALVSDAGAKLTSALGQLSPAAESHASPVSYRSGGGDSTGGGLTGGGLSLSGHGGGHGGGGGGHGGGGYGAMSQSYAGGGMGSSGGPPTGPMPAGAMGDWIREALEVLRSMGYDTSQIDPRQLAMIIEHESGGDPRSINLWDSNAAAGTPSKGIMQTIDSTFDAYKAPGHDDIWNPVDNIVAATRYAIDRYGAVSNVPGIVGVSNGGGYVGY